METREQYLEEKVKFLEGQIEYLMDVHNPGGTLTLFRDYQETASQPEDSANQESLANQCIHGIGWQNPCGQCGRAICR